MKRKTLVTLLTAILIVCMTAFVACSTNTTPDVQVSKDTVLTEVSGTPGEIDDKLAVFAVLGKLQKSSGYSSEGTGKSVAQKGFIRYEQNTSSVFIKNGDEYYTEYLSNSTFVNLKHEAFEKGSNVAMREDDGEISNHTYEDYANTYGVTPSKLLSAHIYNRNTISYITHKLNEDDTVTFTMVLDKDTAHALCVYQMRQFGGLNGFPAFTDDTTLELTVNKNFTPVSLKYKSNYDVNVTVLGTVSCTEEFLTTFDFTNVKEIPDTDKFNEALGTTPTVIEEDDDDVVDQDAQAVVNALLSLDVTHGVTANGVLSIGDIDLNFKVNFAVDVDKIVSGESDVLDAIQAKLSLFGSDKLTCTYQNGKFYVNFLGKKYAFTAPENDEEADVEEIENLKLGDVLKIVKSQDKDGTYIVTLSDDLNDQAFDFFNKYGLAENKENFSLQAELYLPGATIGTATATLKTEKLKVTAKLNLSDEKYDEVINEEEYSTEIGFGASFYLDLSGSFNTFDSEDAAVKGQVNLIYDTEETNPVKAFKAQMDLTILPTLGNVITFAKNYSSDIPDALVALASASHISVYFENGNLYAVAYKTVNEVEQPYFIKQFDISLLSDDDDDGEESNIGATIAEIFDMLDVRYSNDMLTITPNETALTKLRSLWNKLPTFIAQNLGHSAAAMLPGMFGINNAPLSNVELNVSPEDEALTLTVTAFTVGGKVPYVEGKTYPEKKVIELGIALEDPSDYTYDVDIDAILKDDEKASVVRDGFDGADFVVSEALSKLTSDDLVSVLEDYAQALQAKYDALTDEQKAYVYNYKDLYTEYVNAFTSADKFITLASDSTKSISTLNTSYNKLNDYQLKYVELKCKEDNSNALNSYIEKRTQNESAKLSKFNTDVEKLDTTKDLSSMTLNQLKTYLSSLISLNTTAKSLYKANLTEENLNKLEGELNRATKAYSTVALAKFNAVIETLNDFVTADEDDLPSVDEMNEFYNTNKTLYSTYYNTVKDAPFEKDDAFIGTAYLLNSLVNQYNGSFGFRQVALRVADKELASLDVNYSTYEDFTAKMTALNTLVATFDETALSAYAKYTYYNSLISMYSMKLEIIDLTKNLIAVTENYTNTDSATLSGIDSKLTKLNSKISSFNNEQKMYLLTEIAEYNQAKAEYNQVKAEYTKVEITSTTADIIEKTEKFDESTTADVFAWNKKYLATEKLISSLDKESKTLFKAEITAFNNALTAYSKKIVVRFNDDASAVIAKFDSEKTIESNYTSSDWYEEWEDIIDFWKDVKKNCLTSKDQVSLLRDKSKNLTKLQNMLDEYDDLSFKYN